MMPRSIDERFAALKETVFTLDSKSVLRKSLLGDSVDYVEDERDNSGDS